MVAWMLWGHIITRKEGERTLLLNGPALSELASVSSAMEMLLFFVCSYGEDGYFVTDYIQKGAFTL